MQSPLRITMRDIPPSDAIEQHVRQRASKLERLCSTLTACHVTIETPHRHKTHGNHYRVRIDLSVPGTELVVARDPAERREHEDAYAAIDAAFEDAERMLKDHIQKKRSATRRTEARIDG
ncbi:MAG: hypothetical protein BGO98_13835 [Myxococcales bacterium 68-20]|nr:ribosome-associated translation inhibitor RaiA [Myxococcales bacterium]OJY21144.1 MAG: hypothetical protein BGO98_13835 [Myxococcales bacterium 68-20]